MAVCFSLQSCWACAGISLEDSLATAPEISGASANVNGQTLTIKLGAVTEKTTVTFDTEVDPEILGFGGDQPVVVENTIIETFARFLVPEIRKYYDSEQGQWEFTEWQEATSKTE